MMWVNLPLIIYKYRRFIFENKEIPLFFTLSLTTLLSVGWLSFYGVVLWPKLSPIVGGGEPAKVEMVIQRDCDKDSYLGSLLQHDSTHNKTIKLFYQTPNTYIFQIESDSSSIKLVEMNKNDIEALIFSPP